MAVRNRFSERVSVKVECKGVGKVKPEFKQSCDVNHILTRYQRTGQLPLMVRKPIYGDVSTVPEFQESMHIIIAAQEQFENLPAQVRKRFGHDPEEFLAFMNDPKNLDEMRRLGLANPEILVKEPEKVLEPKSEEGSE